MKKFLIFLISLGFIFTGYCHAATHQVRIHWSYDYQPPEGRTLAGYRLYKEGESICTSTIPSARAMDCNFESEDGSFDFTITAFSTDGFESPHSTPYTYTATTPSVPPVAIISPTTLSGEAPFKVTFNGSASTAAVSYSWVFGDGATANSSQINHTFSTPGTYITSLTVSNVLGQTHTTNATVTVKNVIQENKPPTAVISSSTTMGKAPLTVSFDGSRSYDTEGQISSCMWNFGDGTSGHGTTAGHIYKTPGSFTATLTVTDNGGATNTTTTPVIITEQTEENLAPTAKMTTTVTNGTAPLEVTFDGSTSTDPEESQLTYSWNFGDGSSEQGAIATHTYTNSGTYTATLTVSDDLGSTSSTTTTIDTTGTPAFQIELGEVEINNNWIRVLFSTPFINPIVVAGPPSYNGADPSIIRLKNITTTGFDIRIQEWKYLDGGHMIETVAFLVIEKGSFILDDGTKVETGQFGSKDINFHTIQFDTVFTTAPVVISSIATFNGPDPATSRLRNISTTSFAHKLQEQELSNGHNNETINYIAWEPSQNNIEGINVIVNITADKVRHRWYTIDYNEQLTTLPVFLGNMQSQDGPDTGAIRYTNMTNNSVQVKIEEEKSRDEEIAHTTERIGYFLFSEANTESFNASPIAAITADTTEGISPLSVSFDGSNSTDQDGGIVTYEWNFGGDNTSTGVAASYVFTEVGSHPVSLTITDDKGATSRNEIAITVKDTNLTTHQFDARINAGNNDAEEAPNGTIRLASSDLELITDPWDKSHQVIGLRFTSVIIPKGAQIINAYIEFETDETNSSQTSLQISAESTPNAPPFTSAEQNISTRNTLHDIIPWDNVSAWNDINQKHQSPDISRIVQQLINQNEWHQGNAIAFIITGESGCRTAESYEGEPLAAPLFHVEYQLSDKL